MLLRIDNLCVNYGAIRALHGVSLQIERGEIVALIGSNGAGKSTLLRTLSGLIRPAEGQILFDPQNGARIAELHKLPTHQIVRLGVVQIPEGRQVFANMTVRENLLLGGYLRGGEARTAIQEIFDHFPVLSQRRDQKAGTLSGGEQQMLAIGRALMAKPTLLLMDEPSLGLAPLFVRKIFDLIKQINAQGTTVFLVEQNAHMALTVAHRAYVLQTGRVILTDRADKLLENPDVQRAYLGG